MAELIIQSGKHQGKKLVLSQPQIIIGRSPECHIRLATADISKQHCLLRSTPEGIFVLDLGSRNGTFVNDQVIQHETLLVPGDRLRVGPLEFQVPPGKPRSAAGAKRTPRGVSDDDIAHWLTDETRETDATDDTTTIITSEHNLEPAHAAQSPNPVPAPPAPSPEPAKRQFRTVAEESTEIIQRWKSMQGPQA